MSPRSSNSVARLGALIDDVLDLTQSDSGSLLLAEDKVDLATLCAEAAEAFAEPAAKKGIDFAVEIEAGAGTIAGDRAPAAPVARQCAQERLRLYRRGRAGAPPRRPATARAAAITVSDNGRGIAPADQARVFDRFHRTAEPRGGEEAALGLGLPLARQFVEAHGGTIELRLGAGRGDHRHPPPAAEGADERARRARTATEALGPARWRAQLRPGDVVALFGDLGAGKTTLARGISPASAIEGEVASPTFPIVHSLRGRSRLPVWHVDLYRIEDPGGARGAGARRGAGATAR